MAEAPFGILEQLVTDSLRHLLDSGSTEHSSVDESEVHRQIARHIASSVERAVHSLPADRRLTDGVEVANALIDELVRSSPKSGLTSADRLVDPATLITAITDGQSAPVRPLTPLSETVLFTNAPDEPQMAKEIGRELLSASSADALVAFIKWTGIRLIEDELTEFLGSGRRLRLITTTYTGVTERTALDRLARMGAQIKVSYDNRSTRLHAKAWLFRRDTGFDTAWIGSSNLSRAAMVDGLEWNIRASSVTTPEVIQKFAGTFDSYWEDPDFEAYDPERDAERFDTEVGRATDDQPLDFSFIDVRPYPFQQEMLDQLELERSRHGRYRNLVVAATGTGKTMVAALDYRRLREQLDSSKLLFVAHREEILNQSISAFRAVLRDGTFGETWVRGQRPKQGEHVFASIQSLTAYDATQLDPGQFDVVIVDEFHHAAASTYRALLNHVEPQILLGLTATPERADGQSVLEWFDNRIAVELRLWDALDQDLLVPFHYFGIHDDVDLSGLAWSRGGYQLSDLGNLYTGNDSRVRMVLQAVKDKIGDPLSMKALGFCVSIAHAEYMAMKFTEAGIPSLAVSATTSAEERAAALRKLRDGDVNVVFAVDLFNEGVDVPAVDTVLFLRPTESATIFLQQLGRGLRRSHGKSVLTVLDFVGQQHRKFRFDLKYKALTGQSRVELIRQAEEGFPFLPSGCHMDLDRVAREVVLDNLRSALPTRWPDRVAELRSLGDVGLVEYIDATGLTLEDIYSGGRSWTQHRREVGFETTEPTAWDEKLGKAFGRMLHIDDELRIGFYRTILDAAAPPTEESFDLVQRRLLFMLHLSLWGVTEKFASIREGFDRLWASGPLRHELSELLGLLDERVSHVQYPFELDLEAPLMVHAMYSRDEVLAAMGVGSPDKPPQLREGVKWVPEANTDMFLFQLNKSERDFSPTTRYNDYAISPELFHWESQSTTSVASPTGQRYLNHREMGTNVLLFSRVKRRSALGGAAPYLFLGPADYVTHQGDRPIAITWKLWTPLPADFYIRAKLAAGT